MKRRIRKSTIIVLGFALYSAAIYVYFIPRTDLSGRRIWFTLALNVVVLVALWYLYRRKEDLAAKIVYEEIDAFFAADDGGCGCACTV